MKERVDWYVIIHWDVVGATGKHFCAFIVFLYSGQASVDNEQCTMGDVKRLARLCCLAPNLLFFFRLYLLLSNTYLTCYSFSRMHISIKNKLLFCKKYLLEVNFKDLKLQKRNVNMFL